MADRSASQATILELLSTRPDNPEELAKVYDKWAKDGRYDKDVTSVNKRGSVFVSDELEVLFPEIRAGVRILDVGAGSGRAAKEVITAVMSSSRRSVHLPTDEQKSLRLCDDTGLKKLCVGTFLRSEMKLPPRVIRLRLRRRGFTNLDALDPSQGMLDVAMEKKLYNNYTCALINEKPVDIQGGTYDALVSVGAIAQGHLPATCMVELLRLTKIGGVVAIVGSATEWNRLPEYSDKMTKLIKQLGEQGKLNIIKWTTRPEYMFSGTPECADGIIIIVRKL